MYVFCKISLNNTFLFLQSIVNYMGEDKLQTFINFSLNALSKLTLPRKRYCIATLYSYVLRISSMNTNECATNLVGEFLFFEQAALWQSFYKQFNIHFLLQASA